MPRRARSSSPAPGARSTPASASPSACSARSASRCSRSPPAWSSPIPRAASPTACRRCSSRSRAPGTARRAAARWTRCASRSPLCRHLVITCNADGRLATRYDDDPRVATIVLDERTNDKSLVMTSSFTNMVLAGRLLAQTRDADGYRARVSALARQGADMLLGPCRRAGPHRPDRVPHGGLPRAAATATAPRARPRSRCWR